MNEFAEKYKALLKEHEELQGKYEGLKAKYDDLQEQREYLEKRLMHLMESDFIRRFDEYNPAARTYALDIRDADNLVKALDELSNMDAKHRHELEMLKECIARMTMERLGVS